MKKQRGAALVVVLSLLSISLMVGVSSMQASHVNERLAGNYRSSSQAQMNAERAASELVERVFKDTPSNYSNDNDGQWEKIPMQNVAESDALDAMMSWGQMEGIADLDEGKKHCSFIANGDGVACFINLQEAALGLDAGFYILAMGRAGVGDSESELVVVEIGDDSAPGLAELSPLTVVSRIFNFRSGNSSGFGISRRGESNIGTAISVADERDVSTVMDGIPDNRKDNYSVDEDGQIVAERSYDVFSDPVKMKEFIEHVKNDDGTVSSVGTREDPKVTYIDGSFTMPKNIGVGGGVLVVDGDFTWNGNNDFEGLIIVLGQNFTYSGGGSGSMIGAILHAPVVEASNGDWSYGIAEADASEVDLRGGGGSIIQHDIDVLNSSAGLLPDAAAALFERPDFGAGEGIPTLLGWK